MRQKTHVRFGEGDEETRLPQGRKVRLVPTPLEWPLVIVVGLYEGSLPHAMAYNGGATKDPPDERRLAYVALSRAAEHLHLTAPRHVEANGHLVAVPLSRYLGELPGAPYG